MFSNKYKFIFIHSQKCGGGSISEILMNYYGGHNFKIVREKQHDNISEYLKQTIYPITEYYKFGCTRNPWDRMVSLFYHAKKTRQMEQ